MKRSRHINRSNPKTLTTKTRLLAHAPVGLGKIAGAIAPTLEYVKK